MRKRDWGMGGLIRNFTPHEASLQDAGEICSDFPGFYPGLVRIVPLGRKPSLNYSLNLSIPHSRTPEPPPLCVENPGFLAKLRT